MSTPIKLAGIMAATLSLAGPSLAQGNDPTPTAKAEKADGKGSMSGMNMSRMVEGSSAKGMTSMSGMTAQVPRLKEKGVMTVKGDENWNIRTGFGRNAEMAGMMIQMMTEGAPKMGQMGVMKMDYGPVNFTETADEKNGTGAAGGGMAGMDMSGSRANTTGSSMAGIDMAGMKADGKSAGPVSVSVTPNPPVRGDNALDILVTDPATGKPVSGLKLSASVEMATMDMGITKPAVKEMGNGHYAATATFSMNGPWRVTLVQGGKTLATQTFQAGGKRLQPQNGADQTAPAAPTEGTLPAAEPAKAAPGAKTAVAPMAGMDMSAPTKAAPPHGASGGLQVTAKVGAGTAAVGDNKVQLTILDAAGKPLVGAKVTAAVEMTSMDMGVMNPTVKEIGNGVYATTANFGMSGPWKITVRVTASGKPVVVRTVPVTVKRK
jgi:nitrogen fixation protein FixH